MVLPLAWLAVFAMATDPCRAGADLFAARHYIEAQTPLWECVEAGAPSREPAHQLALTYREAKNYSQGWERASHLLVRSKSVDLLYVAAFLKFRMGDNRESIRLLGEAFRLDNYDWRVHHAFALNYIVMDIRPGALAELQTAIRLNPGNAELYYQLARLEYIGMRIDESIAASRKALELFPEYPEVYSNLGLCYEAAGQDDKARENFERAIATGAKLGSRDEWPYINYGAFLVKQGEAEPALPLLDEALRRNPASARAHYHMGRALRRLDRLEAARKHLEESIRLDATGSDAHYELGMLLARSGDTAASRRLLDRFKLLKERERERPATTRGKQ